MIFLASELPKVCPECGKHFVFGTLSRVDFFSGASQQCDDCNTLFQFAPKEALVDTARVHGDLHHYAN